MLQRWKLHWRNDAQLKLGKAELNDISRYQTQFRASSAAGTPPGH